MALGKKEDNKLPPGTRGPELWFCGLTGLAKTQMPAFLVSSPQGLDLCFLFVYCLMVPGKKEELLSAFCIKILSFYLEMKPPPDSPVCLIEQNSVSVLDQTLAKNMRFPQPGVALPSPK